MSLYDQFKDLNFSAFFSNRQGLIARKKVDHHLRVVQLIRSVIGFLKINKHL